MRTDHTLTYMRRVFDLAAERGETLDDVALAAGIPTRSLWRAYNGARPLTLDEALALAEVTDVALPALEGVPA